MVWIESHDELRNHPKIMKLCQLLSGKNSSTQSDKAHIVGHLHFLWWWCLTYAIDGNVSMYTPLQIADAAGWEGDVNVFFQALLDANFLDKENDEVRIHDWFDFCGEIAYKRLQRKSLRKCKSARIGAIRQPKTAENRRKPPKSRLPNLTEPNLTEPTSTTSFELPQREALDDSVIPAFPVIGKEKEWRLSKELLAEFQTTYPAIDVLQECKNARMWCVANTGRRKTYSGMAKFLNSWIARAQNRGGSDATKPRYGKSFNRGDNTAGTVDTSKYDKAGIPD